LPPIPGFSKDAMLSQTGTQAGHQMGDRQPARHRPAGTGTGGQERASIAYEQLDRLYRLSGELTVSVSALSGQRHQLRTLALELSQALQQLNRLAGVAQTDGLARESLQESLRGVNERLTRASGECAALGGIHDRMEGRLTHLSDDLADEVTQARLVPLSELLDDYPRMLRDLAHELGKRVELRIDGAENRIDRAVLERLRDPLRHMVRNALGHGIEPADERRRLGKAETGRLVIEARQLGSMMRIRVADDGRGIDLDRLRQTVVDNGHTSAALWAAMGIDEQMQFLFLPGLSTATTVDTTQGRGFGLDIVKNAIDASGGHIGVHSEHGQGTCFELQVPLMLSLTRCLLVQGGRHPLFGVQRYAFPMNEVAAIRRIDQGQLREVEGRLAVHLDDEMLLLHELHQVLGLAPTQRDMHRKHLLVLGDGERRYGLLADEVIDEMDMVSRPLDQRLGKVRDVSGLTLLDDGGVALIIDIPDLLARMDDGSGRLSQLEVPPTPIAEPAAEPEHILVVEDSVTVREVERHFLEQAGYRVTTAVNGVDGLNKAKTGNYDLLITDIDMPRMNGIELIRTLRGIDRFKALPIIVVSYKDRAEDRQKTLEAGADRYVTKSEFDTDAMLDLVAEMLRRWVIALLLLLEVKRQVGWQVATDFQ
jgi:two-component system sensor histidine kinase and response regulator WspE